MCIPNLQGKRVDVTIKGTGTTAAVSMRNLTPSDKVRANEGKHGYLLLVEPITAASLTKRINVPGVVLGSALPVPPMCIKPRRFTDDGVRIDQQQVRVVIIGPDVNGGTGDKGCYGQTASRSMWAGSTDIVGVKLDTGALKNFHFTSLCLAINVGMRYKDVEFAPSHFI